ncbi:MAG TPA: hypothetical protein PLX89_02840 [Verrucomicrobiota bacterium]|nr:hypothetical protein [Verrucomicrobiales bacterium]HRI11917.1 hypothetical protein [Verrucomicrobiota bacterium]
MKTLRITVTTIPRGFGTVRRFGQAALVSDRLGRWQLLGGNRPDRLKAREWVSLFCHEALVDTLS